MGGWKGTGFDKGVVLGRSTGEVGGVSDIVGIFFSFRCRGQHGLEFGLESMDVVCSVIELICELLRRRFPSRSLSFTTTLWRKAVRFRRLCGICGRRKLLPKSLCIFVSACGK